MKIKFGFGTIAAILIAVLLVAMAVVILEPGHERDSGSGDIVIPGYNPDSDVPVILEGLNISQYPVKTEYLAGETFDRKGLVVYAVYSDGHTENVSDDLDYSKEPLTAGFTSVIISFTENEVTVSAPVPIMVYDSFTVYSEEDLQRALASDVSEIEFGASFTGIGMLIAGETDRNIDLAGYTYTISGNNSVGLIVSPDSTVVITGGEIKADDSVGAVDLVRAFGDVTLSDVKLTGNSSTSAVVAAYGGTVEIDTSSEITASNGNTAVLLGDDSDDDRIKVIIKGKVTGNIDISDKTTTGYRLLSVSEMSFDGKYYYVSSEDETKTEMTAVKDTAELNSAINSNSPIIMMDGEYNLPSLSGKDGIVIIGTEDVVITGDTYKGNNVGFTGNFGENTVIKNLTFSGEYAGTRYTYTGDELVLFEHCVFEGGTRGFHIDGGKQLRFVNCTFTGFNAFASSLEVLSFDNCTLLHNGKYGLMNIYNTATFNDCIFAEKTSIDLTEQTTTVYVNNCNFADNTAINCDEKTGNIIIDGITENYPIRFIGTKETLSALANSVNNGSAKTGEKFVLLNDIDLTGVEWTPIGKRGAPFDGIFEGRGYAISNLNVTATEMAGFFGYLQGEVYSLNFDNATVIGNHWAGVVAGYCTDNCGTKIIDCHVFNSTVTLSAEQVSGGWDNGDKAGGIMGYLAAGKGHEITGCTVTNTTIQGYRDLGGIVGECSATVSDCSIESVTIIVDKTHDYKGSEYTGNSDYDANSIVGGGGATVTNCAGTATVEFVE